MSDISVGTPAKNYTVYFNPSTSDLTVMDVNATYYSSWCAPNCTYGNAQIQKRNLYNASQSSSYSAVNSNTFYGTSYVQQGTTVNDVVNISGFSQTMNFGDLIQVDGDYLYAGYKIDGMFGLSAGLSSNKIKSALQQVLSGLSTSVVTLHSNMTYPASDAELLFGSKALPQCNQNNWQTIAAMPPAKYQNSLFGVVNATSISSPAVLGGCDKNVTATHLVKFTDSWWSTGVSFQALQVFKKATNAVFDASAWGWAVDCTQMSNFSNVNIGLADGNTLVLTPQDYIYTNWRGKCLLDVYAAYDDDDTTNSYYSIRLGQGWLNSRCISYDSNANTISYTDALPNNGN